MNTLVPKIFLLIGILSAIEPTANGQWLVYSQIDTMPYFALHPPVYYSRHVARTYGFSPFALPAECILDIRAAEVRQKAEFPAEQREVEPLRIDNPFVVPEDGGAVTGARKPSGRHFQRIFPVAAQHADDVSRGVAKPK
jgi:hypothetical protein